MLKPLVAATLAAGTILTPVVTAAPALAACPVEYDYSFSSITDIFYRDPNKTLIIYPGVTGSITVSSGHSWSGTIGGSLETSVSAFIASAKTTVSASVTYTRTTDVAYGGSWTNTTSSAKWLAFGSSGKSFRWQYGHTTPTCGWTTTSSGSAQLSVNSTPAVKHQ